MKKLWIFIIPFIFIIMFFYIKEPVKADKQFKNTVKVRKMDIVSSLTASGMITLKNKANAISGVNGVVNYVYVNEGDSVKKGDVLAVLDTTDIDGQIKGAELKLSIENDNYNLAKDYKNTPDYINLKNKVLETWGIYDSLQTKVSMAQTLVDEKKISSDVMKRLLSDLDKAYNSYNMAKYNLHQMEEKAETNINSLAKSVQIAQNELEILKEQRSKYVIKSPISGMVLNKYIDRYDNIMQGKPVFLIGDLKSMRVEADINQYDLLKVKKGQNAKIVVQGINDLTYTGQVDKICPSLDVIKTAQGSNNTGHIVIDLNNNTIKNLKVGYTVDVTIITGEVKNTLVIPIESVIKKNGNEYVYIKNNKQYIRRQIQTGLKDDFYVQVLSGLNEGDVVLYNTENASNNDTVVSSLTNN